MNILGINAYADNPASVLLQNAKVKFAAKEELFTRKLINTGFPTLSCRHSKIYLDKIDVVTYSDKPSFFDRRIVKNKIKQHIYGKYDIEFFDTDDCYAMNAVSSTDWDRCAVLLVKTNSDNEYSTRLGYFSDNKVYWIKNFYLKNSIGTFYQQANKFLGKNNIVNYASSGDISWAESLREVFINEDFSFKIDIANLKEVPNFPVDNNLLTSIHHITAVYIQQLANWLQQETNCNKLAFVGDITKDYVINGFLKRYTNFSEISVSPISSDAGTALGAASFIQRPSVSYYVGKTSEEYKNSEEIADLICKRKVTPVIFGNTEFSDIAMGSRCLLAAPTKENISLFHKLLELEYPQTFTVVCTTEAAKEYLSEILPNTYYSKVKDTCSYIPPKNKVPVLLADNIPFLKAVLSKTMRKGYPILIMAPLQRKNYPLINTLEDYNIELGRLVSKFT
jgi:predicted NodU family carbamoyl transferase